MKINIGKQTEKLIDDFQQLRDQIANQWLEDLRGFKIACSAGCHYCCALVVRCHFLEGLVIARELLRIDDHVTLAAVADHAQVIEHFRNKLIMQAGDTLSHEDFTMLWMEQWAEEQIFCPFLKEKHCSIYPLRPLTCRVHLAVDSRIPCMIPSNQVRVIDATQPHRDGLALAVQRNTAMGWEPLIIPAPISVSVRWGQRYLLGEDIEEIKKQ